MLPIDLDLGNIGDLGHPQLFGDLGAYLGGIAIDGLTAAEYDVTLLLSIR